MEEEFRVFHSREARVYQDSSEQSACRATWKRPVSASDHKLVKEWRRKGWKARCELTEMGCRGDKASTSHLYVPCVRSTPLPAWQEERRAIKSTKEAAERALRRIWVKKVWRVDQCCWDTSQVLINLGWVAEWPQEHHWGIEIYQSGFRKNHSTERDTKFGLYILTL